MKLKDLAHEWLADNVKGVQYPNVYRGVPKEKPPFFKHKMPWYVRLSLVGVLVPVIILLFALAAVFGTIFFWSMKNLFFG